MAGHWRWGEGEQHLMESPWRGTSVRSQVSQVASLKAILVIYIYIPGLPYIGVSNNSPLEVMRSLLTTPVWDLVVTN